MKRVMEPGLSLHRDGAEARRGGGFFRIIKQEGPDHRVGTDQTALVALEAFRGIPHRDLNGNTPLFVGRKAHVDDAVLVSPEGADREVVALLAVDGIGKIFHHIRPGVLRRRGGVFCRKPRRRDPDLMEIGRTFVNGGKVPVHHIVSLCEIGASGQFLHVNGGLRRGDHVGQGKEGRLEDQIVVAPQPQSERNGYGINGIDFGFLCRQEPLDVSGEFPVQFLKGPRGVDQEGPSVLQFPDHVVLFQVGLVVTADEVGGLDVIGGADGGVAETQMGFGDAEGFLCIVFKIRLGEFRGVIVDDLHGTLVGPHGAVGTEAPEFAADDLFIIRIQGAAGGEREVRHVIHDPDGEIPGWVFLLQVVKDRFDLGRVRILAGEAVPAANDPDPPSGSHRRHVQKQRLSGAAHFLAAVQNRDAADAFRQGVQEIVCGKGPVEMDLQKARFFALPIQTVHGFFDCTGDGAHGHNDPVRIGGAVVVKKVIPPAGDLRDRFHVIVHDPRQCSVKAVVGFPDLKEDVRILHRGPETGVFRIQCLGPEGFDGLVIHQSGQVFIGELFHLGHFVGGAEPVKEVQEGDPALYRRQMGHGRQIHDLLGIGGGEHGKPGLAAVHHVRVIAENGEGMGPHRAGCHMKHPREPFSGDPVHDRDHQEKPLGGGEACGKRPRFKSAVNGPHGPGFRLHFHQRNLLAEEVDFSFGRPCIGLPRHGGRRGDGVNGGHFGKGVGNVGARLVAVHRHKFFFRIHDKRTSCVRVSRRRCHRLWQYGASGWRFRAFCISGSFRRHSGEMHPQNPHSGEPCVWPCSF